MGQGKRYKMSRRSSRKSFSKSAGLNHMHRKNVKAGPAWVMRGGIRL